ncbi:MAG: hypothetical protein MJZ72_05415 [Bacteroidales bacterium]|nr:hypothetical protein [Bacteroidales bacterium]
MKTTVHTILFFIFCSLSFWSCNNKPSPPPLGGGNSGEDPSYSFVGGKTSMNSNSQSASDPPKYAEQPEKYLQQVCDIWSYTSQIVTIPEQTTMERAVCNISPNMRKCYNYDNVGGVKLIGEMCADRAGYNYSLYTYPITLKILSLSQLHLRYVSSYCNVICKVLDGHVKIESAKIISRSGGEGLCVEVEVKNISQIYQEVEFEQGQLIEVNELHAQNVVITSNAKAQLNPNEVWQFSLPALCAAHHRNSPKGFGARITPYVLDAPAKTFQSQQKVWDVLESNEDPDSYVTFYVWEKGTITSSGRRSRTGHTFVRIPKVGVVGFSSLHGGILDDEGYIFDYTSDMKYATDSCRIKVSEEAMKAMTRKLRQLQQEVPKYRVGHYDCTSFVMDIADAGDVHYGKRNSIRTPEVFMQELKKHNYSY